MSTSQTTMNTSPFPGGAHVAAYVRDSGGEAQDLSVDQQEQELQDWCRENQLTISKIFRDIHRPGTSTDQRDGFEDMMAYFRSKNRPPEAGVVLWKLSRFSRNIDDAQFYKADLRRRGFIIHSITDPIPTGMDGRLFESAYDWMNNKFIESMRAEVKRGLHFMVKNGAMPGVPPRGFKRQPLTIEGSGGSHKVHRWVPDPDIWETCKHAWHLRAAGRSLGDILKETHLFTSVNSLVTFFKNPIYRGELRYGSLVIPNYVEPMVDEITWNKVQSMRSKHIRNNQLEPGSIRHPRRATSRYLLSGLVRCAVCGSPMHSSAVQSNATGSLNEYYVCSRKVRNRNCSSRNIPKDALELAVINELLDQVLVISTIRNLMADYHDSSLDSLEIALKSSTGRLVDVNSQIKRLVDAIAKKGGSKSLLDKLDQLENAQRELELEIYDQKDLLGKARAYNPAQVELMIKGMAEALREPDEDLQRKALRSFVKEILVERVDKKIKGAIKYWIPHNSYEYNECPQGAKLYIHNFTNAIPVYPRRKRCQF